MLRAFEQSAPNARLSFRMLIGDDAVNALLRDEIDLALGRFAEIPATLCAQPLLQDEFCVVARQGHPAVRGSIDRQTYVELGHTVVTVSGDLADIGENALQSLGIQRRVVGSVPRFFVAFTIVAESDGLATVPRSLAERYAAMLSLQVLPLPFHMAPISIGALRRSESNGDPSIDWLVERVRAATTQ
jgi:DNA-binding transcriptional LysR family regulator